MPRLTRIALPALLLTGACGLLGRGGAMAGTAATASVPPASAPTASVPPSSARSGATAATPGLTDANIAAIVVAANRADVLYADLALAKSRDAEVRAFATMVKLDHESINQAAVALVTRLKVTPVDNQLSFDLRDDADTKRLLFRDLEGFAFDSAYASNEVSYHASVLGAIDKALIPSARNAELRDLLIQARPAVAAHLDHATAMAAKQMARRR